jgi:hypothetical protein
MCHGYDYISLFAPFLDIPVSLGNLLQRIVLPVWRGTNAFG